MTKILFKFLCGVIFLSLNLNAKEIINAVSIIVNNEPITLYEIHSLAIQMQIDKNEALNLLIEKKLQESEIKKFGIEVDKSEVEAKIAQFAVSNNLSVEEFKLNTEKNDPNYHEKIIQAIKQEKLYSFIFSQNPPIPSQSEIEAFYNQNRPNFIKYTNFKVTIYSSYDQNELVSLSRNPLQVISGVKSTSIDIDTNKIEPRFAFYLNQVPNGSFTSIMPKQDGSFDMILMNEKNNPTFMNIDEAKPIIMNQLAKKYETKALKNYFDKLKASASIETIRKP